MGTGENNRVKSKGKTATTQGMREDGLTSVWTWTVNSLGGITVLRSSCVLRLSATRFSSVTTDYRSLSPCISGVRPLVLSWCPVRNSPHLLMSPLSLPLTLTLHFVLCICNRGSFLKYHPMCIIPGSEILSGSPAGKPLWFTIQKLYRAVPSSLISQEYLMLNFHFS